MVFTAHTQTVQPQVSIQNAGHGYYLICYHVFFMRYESTADWCCSSPRLVVMHDMDGHTKGTTSHMHLKLTIWIILAVAFLNSLPMTAGFAGLFEVNILSIVD
jgi:hypothetical protein